jgi:hypothetical protein
MCTNQVTLRYHAISSDGGKLEYKKTYRNHESVIELLIPSPVHFGAVSAESDTYHNEVANSEDPAHYFEPRLGDVRPATKPNR